MRILILGLPGSGKTTLARLLCDRMDSVLVNADVVRHTLSADLGFSHEDRIRHARRMRQICEIVEASGKAAIADFVCPTAETREEFDAGFVIWMDTISDTPYADTARLFSAPNCYHLRIANFSYSLEAVVQAIEEAGVKRKYGLDASAGKFDFSLPTSLVIGDCTRFEEVEKQECLRALAYKEQVCIAVSESGEDFDAVTRKIRASLTAAGVFDTSLVHIMRMPAVKAIRYANAMASDAAPARVAEEFPASVFN